jgi:hypothetical protein
MSDARQTRTTPRGRTIQVLTALLLLLLLGQQSASAQWTTSGNTTTTTNNVGIGTAAPTSALEVQAPDAPFTLSQAGVASKVSLQAALGRDMHLSANGKYSGGTWNRFDTGTTSWNFMLSTVADYAAVRRSAAGVGAINWTELLVIKSNGHVGIGTSNPASPLTVTSDANVTPLLVSGNNASVVGLGVSNSNPGSKGWALQVTGSGNGYNAPNGSLVFRQASDNTNPLVITPAGSVGVGTAQPASIFTVNRSNSDYTNAGGATAHVLLTNTNGTGQTVIQSIINGVSQGKWRTDYAGNVTYVSAAGGHHFLTGGDFGVGNVRMSILNNGHVGIGTGTPTQALDVNGNVNVSGSINAKYQDVAEWVPAARKLAAGTVVVLDAERVNHVVASTKAYDTRVAGVVSARPGISLGEPGEGKLLVATTGRVRVKVDATKGAIKVGDLLVTSNREGVAMASVPVEVGGVQMHRPGTVVGKALEPLAGGVGEILVLLSLQ